jgi:aryl-alcohol dehydrogenase-like predicted oxidoreductase
VGWHFFPISVSQRIAYRENTAAEEIAEGSRACGRAGDQKCLRKEIWQSWSGLIEFAESRNHTVLDLAFAWLASPQTVASVIAGASKPEQIQANAKAVNWKLTSDDLAAIDAIMTGK